MSINKDSTIFPLYEATKKDTADAQLKYGEDNPITVTVKKRLSLADRGRMIKNIASMCFSRDDDGNEIYCPYLVKFAIEYNVVHYFTNLVLSDDPEETCELLEITNIYAQICEAVGAEYISAVIHEAYDLIDYHKQELIKRGKLDGVLESVTGLLQALKEKFEDSSVEEIMDSLKNAFPDISDELINGVITPEDNK